MIPITSTKSGNKSHMNSFKLFTLFIFLFIHFSGYLQPIVPITPYPNKVTIKEGALDLSRGVQVSGDSKYTDYLTDLLAENFEIKSKSNLIISLSLDNDFPIDNQEAYTLKVNEEGINIRSKTESGIFYGIQSLRQLLLNSTEIPLIDIEDKPKFSWRSYMLDEARYFQGEETVKQILDDMALLKLNKFHWHLTNDSGWRVEIESFPLLTQIGSVRDSSQINDNGKKWKSKTSDRKEHKGYYTQKEIKEIIRYAEERQITIIPEISMPGHMSAAIASYPMLGVTKEKVVVPTNFGVVNEVLDVSSPAANDFIHKVLFEISELFPSPYIHIGGDEVKYDHWAQSESINSFMRENKIDSYRDLQVYFTNTVSQFVEKELGKQIIGWNEILGRNVHEWASDNNANTTLSENAIVQFWKGTAEDLLFGIENGHKVINSDHTNTYLDYTYEQIPLKKSYSFSPIPKGLKKNKADQVIGLGAQMWGEWTPTKKEIDYQTYPRIAAYAEVGWTNEHVKNYKRFEENLKVLLDFWKKKGYYLPD